MDSCTTTVKVRKIMGFKDIRKGLIPLLLWSVLMIASLICLRFTPFAVLVMLLVFIAIIPICVYLGKLTAPFRGKESFEKKEVIFNVKDGRLYTDEIELEIEWDETNHSFKHQKGTVVTRFAGIIEEPFADDFMRFLKEDEVEVLDLNSGKRI